MEKQSKAAEAAKNAVQLIETTFNGEENESKSSPT